MSTNSDRPPEPSLKELSFEAMLQRIEQIVHQMESGETNLDKMIEQFEEGQKLVQHCQARLKDAERRVEKLVRDANGSVSAEPFQEI